MKYEIKGGGYIEGASPLELVEALRQDAMAWVPSVSIEDYMVDLASRMKIQNGATIRTDSLVNFLHDCQQCGFIIPTHEL